MLLIMKLFSTSSLNIPNKLNIIIKTVDPKIKTLFFFVKVPKADVIKDLSVSLIPISSSDERRFINEGNNKKVIKKETINPKVIIQPKSIIGFIPLKTKDKNAQIVVRTV